MKLADIFRVVKRGETPEATVQNCMKTYEALLRENPTGYESVPPEWLLRLNRYVDSLADSFLPERFRGKGYSRLRAVYAFPSLPKRYDALPVFPDQNGSEDILVKLRVSPVHALVLPMIPIGLLYYEYDSYHSAGEVEEGVRYYWERALTLKEFLETHRRSDGSLAQISNTWEDERGSHFHFPEVLIPEWELERVRIRT